MTHYLPMYFPEAPKYFHSSRALWFTSLLLKFPVPSVIAQYTETEFIDKAWKTTGRKVNKENWLKDFYHTAKNSIGLPVAKDSQAVKMFQVVLQEHIDLCQTRDYLEKASDIFLKDNDDYKQLITIPGVGPVIALTILAESGDLRRFNHYRQFLKFCGFDLSTQQSGNFKGHTKLSKRCQFSQMQRACDELGITILFANSAQGKGLIRRAFDTLQDRLVPEFHLNKITDMQSANRYLKETFIPHYWRQHISVTARDTVDEFSKIPRHLDLDTILIRKEYRKIRNDPTFSFRNQFYLIDSPLKHSIAKQEIEIRLALDDSFDAYYIGQRLTISEVVQSTKPSLYDLDIQKKIDAIELAEKLGNVSEAARISGCSRETIYRNRRLLKEKGPQALKRTFKANHHHKNRTDKHLEKIIIEFSLDNPHWGQAQVSAQLKTHHNIELSPNGVRGIGLRENMNTSALRVLKSKSGCRLTT